MPSPLNWITDRLPTKADGDKDGDVIGMFPEEKAWCSLEWKAVAPGQPWLAFKPADAANFLNDVAAAVEASKHRRIVSIRRTFYDDTHIIDAVADDGTAWWIASGKDEWTQLPALPEQSSS